VSYDSKMKFIFGKRMSVVTTTMMISHHT